MNKVELMPFPLLVLINLLSILTEKADISTLDIIGHYYFGLTRLKNLLTLPDI